MWPVSVGDYVGAIFRRAEQADPHVRRRIDGDAVGFENPVGDAHDQTAVDDPLQIDLVDHLLDVGLDLAGELDLAHAQGAAFPGPPIQPR